MTPFADAVGFVDCEPGDVPFFEIVKKTGKHESFWSDVEDCVFAGEELGIAFPGFGFVER